ncbi:helix-turn-helix domain-containing protein, partial [Planctomycetota bacterium]
LRDRTGDVEVLTPAFVESLCAELKRTAPVIPPETLKRLVQYHWPTNVRELRNTLKRALVLSDEPELAPELITFGDDTADDDLSQKCLSKLSYEEACRAFDRRYLTAILGKAEGNKTEAAKLAKLHRTTIYDKLRDCGLSERTQEEDR